MVDDSADPVEQARADTALLSAGDETTVLVVSDHGVSRMDGGICINEWLWRNGWLAFKTPPKNGAGLTAFEDCEVDWANTRAWASGGYYGRVFLNMQGREPNGTIAPERYEVMRDLLKEFQKLRRITGKCLPLVSNEEQRRVVRDLSDHIDRKMEACRSMGA